MDASLQQRRFFFDRNVGLIGLAFSFISGPRQTANDISHCVCTSPLSFYVKDCTVGLVSTCNIVEEDENAEPISTTVASDSETTGQNFKASSVFRMKIGKVSAGETVSIETTYTGKTKVIDSNHQTLAIPAFITPQHDPPSLVESDIILPNDLKSGVRITVDITMATGQHIKRLESPSHPIASSITNISSASQAPAPLTSKGFAALSLEASSLDKDFVLNIISDDLETSPDGEKTQITGSPNQATQSPVSDGADVATPPTKMSERVPVALLPIVSPANYITIPRPIGPSFVIPIHCLESSPMRTYGTEVESSTPDSTTSSISIRKDELEC